MNNNSWSPPSATLSTSDIAIGFGPTITLDPAIDFMRSMRFNPN